jgi:hypothetical protein
MIEYFPWRGLALTVFLLGLWSLALLKLDWPGVEWAWIVSLVVGFGACVSELASKRDRITREGIERRSGLLGLRRRLVSYREIEFVEVEEPGRGSRFDVGTLVIRVSGGHERLVAIVEPHEVARIIEQGRKSVTSAQRPAV